MSPTIAVVGAGAMGAPIARRLHKSGFPVTVCDADRGRQAELSNLGLAVVADVRDCAGADVVLILVASVEQVRAVTVAAGGLRDAVDATDPPLVLIMSTVPATCVIEVAAELSDCGARVLDAPISGGVLRAEDGTLSVMIGGGAKDVDAVRPVLDAISAEIFHCGALGSASTTKIVNNIVGTASALVMAEACRIALMHGLDLKQTVAVLDASSGRTWLSTNPGEAAVFFGRITAERADFDALVAIMRKDFGLALGLAAEQPGAFPLLERLKEFADGMGDETYENWQAAGSGTSA